MCQLTERLRHIPSDTVFHAIDSVDGFDVDASLTVVRESAQAQKGSVTLRMDLLFPVDQTVKGARVVVYMPSGYMGEEYPMEDYYLLPPSGSRDLGKPTPRYSFETNVAFSSYDQLMSAFRTPIRLKVVWKDGVHFLEIPPETLIFEETVGQ